MINGFHLSECQQSIMFSVRNVHLYREAGPITETVCTPCGPMGLGDTGNIEGQFIDRFTISDIERTIFFTFTFYILYKIQGKK